eukprot:11110967-Lingulodinium_polyedra.AAC.1
MTAASSAGDGGAWPAPAPSRSVEAPEAPSSGPHCACNVLKRSCNTSRARRWESSSFCVATNVSAKASSCFLAR